MNTVKKKRGIFASRAHSFKENLLDVLKSSPVVTSTPQRKTRQDKTNIVLAKRIGSTDNLTGHLGTAKTTDCLVKELQFALKYFQDVVSKQTHEMLPGCATVVLETVLAIQAFAMNLESPLSTEVESGLTAAFKAVSVLTSWADSVIVEGETADTSDHKEMIIEPVRKAVIVVVNLLATRLGNQSLARGNSLPDITSDPSSNEEEDLLDISVNLSQSSDSILDLTKPPLFPKKFNDLDVAPPLPPKHIKPKLNKSFEDMIAHSYSLRRMEWMSNHISPVRQINNRSLNEPRGSLDTTLENMSQSSISKESLTDTSFDDIDTPALHPVGKFSRSWSSRERSNTSSPSFETLSFTSHHSDPMDHPPAIPRKSRLSSTPLSKHHIIECSNRFPTSSINRKLSQYDNIPDTESAALQQTYNMKQMDSELTPLRISRGDTPPPLPPKKRNIMSYMEMFGRSIIPNGEDLLQGFLVPHDLLHTVWQQNLHKYTDYAPSSLLNYPLIDQHSRNPYINIQPIMMDGPPALPPKKSRSRPGSFRSTCSSDKVIPIIHEGGTLNRFSGMSENSTTSGSSGSSMGSDQPRLAEITKLPRLSVTIPIQRVDTKLNKTEDRPCYAGSLLNQLDVEDHLVYGPQTNNELNNDDNKVTCRELRAGTVDALIVLATQSVKNEFVYQEAFLTTYRTFISPEVLVDKLVYRFSKFKSMDTDKSRRISRASFSLLVRVVDGLADPDFHNKSLLQGLTGFITGLIESGDLGLARALRSQFIIKYEERRTRLLPDFELTSLNSVNKNKALLNFKSVDVAEQMTLLDSNLFLRIDCSELLTWVKEQNEEKSVNLTKFTEHFNNMSYWTRTQILQQPDGKERERYVMKFIKIMKWLRKMNNFNSYLAVLSALDSAPIRRLEWQKNITDGLKEYCSLIDSSSSFRAYRLALGEACPPCIPYIGLVLQDLTFVHIGNPDLMEGKINFAKRWQQFHILDNLRRFQKEQYQIPRIEEIIVYFREFDEYLSEDDMWNLSESIKPRGQPNKGVK